jgi:hypothetical protein
MVKEPFQKPYTTYGLSFLLVAVFTVVPAKGNVGSGHFKYASIGDSYPVRISPQNLFRDAGYSTTL